MLSFIFFAGGWSAERGELRLDQLVEIKEQLSEIKGMLLEKRGDRSEEAAFVREAVAQAASEFPAIERAYLFGSFARGTFGSDSDVDVRIEYDHGMSSTCMMCRSSGSASSRLPGARSTWFPLIVLKRRAWLRP